MDSTKTIYSSFPFDWTIKSTSCLIRYRKAEKINEIDEIFCSIINAKENQIELSELGNLLGFNLQDLAETDILKNYLKGLTEYNLISIEQETIKLTEFGEEALHSKLKYKYFFASTELFESQTVIGENFDFSFKSVFDLENRLSSSNKVDIEESEEFEKKQKLQFQLFGNDIYKGEIIEIYQSKPNISYKEISLQCETFAIDNSFQLSIYKSSGNKPELQFLIDLPENEKLKSKLIRKGMYHHILAEKTLISAQDIETYIDLWKWKELAENPKVDWNDNNIFKLFIENGDGSIWSVISKKAPIENIKSVIQEFAEYWNWTTLTERLDNTFIREQIENFNWDFEELSYKDTKLIISLLSNSVLKDRDWDWNYLSKNLPDEFIEEHIDEFGWDFYIITEEKSEILRNLFKKQAKGSYTDILLSKPWNWKFISNEFKEIFLYGQLSIIAEKVDWHTVLNRFFTNEEITAKCLKDETFKSLLKHHLPDNFVVAHQQYLWTLNLIDFFDQQNLIQWETKSFIQGLDTNENIEWSKSIFEKYHNRITTENGFLNISQRISDFSLIEQFPNFAWNWNGISQNKKLIGSSEFIENAIVGSFSFSDNLLWNEILSQSNFDISFWNKNLKTFYEKMHSEKQILFWKSLTPKENQNYIFENKHFPWDWTFITENCTEENILESFNDEELIQKWDWKIATRKLDKETILDNLEEFAVFIDWIYLVNQVFTIENELSMENELPRIATCLSVVNREIRKDVWKDLTAKIPFYTLFPIVRATNDLNVFEWDWDFISSHSFFPTDIATLNKFKQNLNWSVFSESNVIQQKFNPNSWDIAQEWFNNTDNYLQTFEDNWDWHILSRNENINYNRFFLRKYKSENWDWDYLTEFGRFLTKQKKDKENYLEQLISQFPKIKFEILSNRKDIAISSGLILSTKDNNWDWQILSENEKAEISNELILKLKDKKWNWKALSNKKNIEFSNETLLELADKDWNWNYLSKNENLEFNAEFIEKTKAKSWNWKSVSHHKSFVPTVEILKLTKDFDLDWEHLSHHSSLNPTKELLARFENKWHWDSITKNPKINFSEIDFIQRFADKWNWRFICESGDLQPTKQILSLFKEYLEWNLISSNTNINFTKEIIQEFKQFWNWTVLKENKRVEELLGSYVADEISKNTTLNFIDKIEQQWSEWKGSIYHFSHIDNAVEIIKNRKIQSRNKAKIQGDAAGNVVHLRNDAHGYARFYFRPHTPTQFYNEFLGKNITDGYDSNDGRVSWYEKARGLGFPKCPIPIFFRFSLKEVMFKNEKQCCISNGNMQTGSTQFGSIDKMINKFGFEDLYYTPQQYSTKEGYNKYRNCAQQEFLVKNQLSFDDLNDYEIVCPSVTDRTLLINLLGKEQKDIFSKIVVDRRFYNNENPRVRIEEEENELHIVSEFKGNGYFVLNGSKVSDIEILSGDVNKIDKDKIIFNSFISLRNLKQNLKLNFIDESGRNWFVYANGLLQPSKKTDSSFNLWQKTISKELYNPTEAINELKQNGYNNIFSHKIRHYTLEAHTYLVCNVFENYFAPNYSESISLGLFRSLLILHDIGKSQAIIEGNRNNQYEHTKQIINNLWEKLPYSREELSIVLALLDGDYLGDYFQGKLTVKQASDKLYNLAKSCNSKTKSFLRMYVIYYQCDTASYTADAGGIKFLEHLFDYQDGKKFFDESERLIKMSPKYWKMYKELKIEIENGN